MAADVIALGKPAEDTHSFLAFRLEGVLAILHAIDAGELLAALPACDVAQGHHRLALRLLALAERELTAICAER